MSWRLRVRHTTGYRYDAEVLSSYNEARLTPQTDTDQLTLESTVRTAPAGPQTRYWDYWGTQVTAFEVHRPHTSLEVTATSVVDTAAEKPLPDDTPDWGQLNDAALRDRYVEYLTASSRTGADDQLADLAAELSADRTPGEAVLAVCEAVSGRVAYRPGATGVQTSALEAWRLGSGVCQDIAHVTLAVLRSAGVPARYVSGYLHPRPDAAVGEPVTGESHAWVEAWLGRWWGWDPTNGVPAGARHVVVARGRDYGDVPPLKGLYAGGASQSLGVTVEVTRLA